MERANGSKARDEETLQRGLPVRLLQRITALVQRRYRDRVANGETRPASVATVLQVRPTEGAPVESAVQEEINGVTSAELRPGLVQVALAMARILDNPRAPSAQPAAAKVLVTVLDTLRKGSAQGRRGSLAVVRTMVEKGNESG